ncbi:MAG: galactokinase, partial [bacterium]
AAARDDATIHLCSEDFNEQFTIDLSRNLEPPPDMSWPNYFLGVLDQFGRKGMPFSGMEVLIKGDVPIGAGLSSSSAFEVCAATLVNESYGGILPRKEIALLAQRAENGPFVGVACGIMDQFAAVFAEADKALLIDCHSLDYETVDLDCGAAIVIVDSMKRRDLLDSQYNRRREECEEGLERIRALTGKKFATIRHIPDEVFEKHQEKLPENIRRRLRHILRENARVHQFVGALERGYFRSAGNLLCESHRSLRDDFQVSCAELDCIVEAACGCDGVLGCRMTGAGFGGCAVALVNPQRVEEFKQTVKSKFFQEFGVEPRIYVTRACAGAGFRALS